MLVSVNCSKYRARLLEFLETFCLGWMVVSLAIAPILAADREQEKPPLPSLTAQKYWNEPLSEDQKVLHLLNRITFGARPGDVERVGKIGIEAFLNQELHPERIVDSAVEAKVAALPTLSMNTEELMEKYPQPKSAKQQGQRPAEGRELRREQSANQPNGAVPRMTQDMMDMQGPRRVIMELAQQEVLRAVYSNRQLQEVMVQFWMNHFNIFAPKGADKWLMTSFERDTIRPRALGKFEDLLVATAKSPAMLFYLDNWMSSTPNPTLRRGSQKGRSPFGGPAFGRRGLFGRGIFGRWPVDNRRAGTPRRPVPQPGPMNPARPQNRRGLNENYAREVMELHTLGVEGGYTQRDVIEVARCFSGWTIDRPRQGGGFIFNPNMHDFGAKVVLDHKVRRGHGQEDALEVLHLLAHHPSTAYFISLKLARRFVADDPPRALVDRASQTFLKTQGDIAAVLKTLLTSPEFYSQAAYRAKVKSPLELVASSLRALGGQTDGGVPLLMSIARMGQPMFQYQAPTGFPDRASTWISSNTLLTRVKFALMLAANRIPGTQIELNEIASPPDDASREAIVRSLAQRLVGETLSRESRDAILEKLPANGQPKMADRESPAQVSTIAGLLLASPEFQRR